MKKSCFFILFVAICSIASLLNAKMPSNLHESSNVNSSNFDVFTGIIFWTAKEAGTDCWAESITSSQFTSSNDLEQVHFGWNLGFRVGLGYEMKHDMWDTQIYYTWFHTYGKDHLSKEPGTIHSTFLGNFYVNNPSGAGLSGPAYQVASIAWTIHFNVIDCELGRNFWINKSLALRPFIGIKTGWIHQFIHSKWQNPNLFGAEFFNVGIENIKNNFFGIGPKVGIDIKLVLATNESQTFGLLGRFSDAFMWGHWSFDDIFKNDHQQIDVDLQNINSGASIVETFMGFEWEIDFNQNRSRFFTKLGYEMQFWLDQLQFYSFTAGRLNNELTLQGGILEFSIDF